MSESIRANTLAAALAVAALGLGATSFSLAGEQRVAAASSRDVAVSSVGRYIITFAEAGLARYAGGVNALEATSVNAGGSRKLETRSAAAVAYARYLDGQRAAHVAVIEQALGRAVAMPHAYGINRNGVSAELGVDELGIVAGLPFVSSVEPVRTFAPDTFRGPKFIGADTIWDGTATPAGVPGTRGQGIKVGIIDSGSHADHPSFANDPACGFSASLPKLHAFDCNTSSAGHCTGPMPDAQTSGHGVHTSSTVAGNTVDNTANPAPLLPDGIGMSGVAPCATVYSYRVENATGALSSDAIAAAIESLAVDQIDVANYSIGVSCSNGSPWHDEDRQFLDAVNADVFVAASAGNTRAECPDPVGGVSHMGPWMLTVAASTQDQLLSPALTVTGPGMPPASLANVALIPSNTTVVPATNALNDYPLRTYPPNLSGCSDTGGFPAHTFDNAIAIVRRGFQAPGTTGCSFAEKVINAAAAGATMVVIANNQDMSTMMDTSGTTTPSFLIGTLAPSDDVIAFVSAHLPPAPAADLIFSNGFDVAVPAPDVAVGDYVRGEIFGLQGDVLASFSERGPTPTGFDDLTKPDITGPGVNIYAAGRAADGNYFLDSGTSMSSPHLAGSAALVRAVHPDWSVSEVKSALQTTARTEGTQEDGMTPWTPDQVGSGRVDLSGAALAGLTLDETYANYLAASPDSGALALKDLNLPSMRDAHCVHSCTWTRTLRNRLATSASWTATASATGFGLAASPSAFTLAPGTTQVVTVTAALGGTLQQIAFGQVDFASSNGESPVQHLSVAVKSGDAAPGGDCDNGNCVFKVDTLAAGGDFSVIGCASYCGQLWLNRFTPDPADYPVTITSITTVFGANPGLNVAGDKINVYIYGDGDTNPANGATPLGTFTSWTMPAPTGALVTIPLTTPVVVNGPGDLLVALTNPVGNMGAKPASADGGPFAGRSWLALYNDSGSGTPPNLATSGIRLNPAAISGLNGNWIVRANGTNGSGRPLVLDARR